MKGHSLATPTNSKIFDLTFKSVKTTPFSWSFLEQSGYLLMNAITFLLLANSWPCRYMSHTSVLWNLSFPSIHVPPPGCPSTWPPLTCRNFHMYLSCLFNWPFVPSDWKAEGYLQALLARTFKGRGFSRTFGSKSESQEEKILLHRCF